MDKNTIMSVISMIDVRIKARQDKMKAKGMEIASPAEVELTELRDHLQSLLRKRVKMSEVLKLKNK